MSFSTPQLLSSHTNDHRAVQEPSAGEAGLSYYHEEAGSSADRTLPSSPVDNDAAAGQRALALGLVLADYGAMDQGNGSHGGSSEGGEEVQVKEEEQ